MVYLNITEAFSKKCPSQDLSFFSKFINLEELYICTKRGNDHFHFTGALELLKDLTKLEVLKFNNNNNIYPDIECLPDSLKTIDFNNKKLMEEFAGYYD